MEDAEYARAVREQADMDITNEILMALEAMAAEVIKLVEATPHDEITGTTEREDKLLEIAVEYTKRVKEIGGISLDMDDDADAGNTDN